MKKLLLFLIIPLLFLLTSCGLINTDPTHEYIPNEYHQVQHNDLLGIIVVDNTQVIIFNDELIIYVNKFTTYIIVDHDIIIYDNHTIYYYGGHLYVQVYERS